MAQPRSRKPSPSSGDVSTLTSTDPELDAQAAEAVTRPTTLRGLMRAARAGTVELTEFEEQQIRNHFGFAASEKRTYLERCEVAERISERLGPAELDPTAFPTQTPGDLTPSEEQLAKLGQSD